jgi:hypothetical protein
MKQASMKRKRGSWVVVPINISGTQCETKMMRLAEHVRGDHDGGHGDLVDRNIILEDLMDQGRVS